MACGEIHVGDLGTQILITLNDCDVAVDLSSATVKEMIFMKPDCTHVTVVADFYTDGTDGILSYVTPASFWDQKGNWRLQGVVTFSVSKFRSDISNFSVYPNLDD